MQIDSDSWEEWKAHPITERLFELFLVWAAQQQTEWVVASWAHGQADPLKLCERRAKASILEQLAALKREDLEEEDEQNRQG